MRIIDRLADTIRKSANYNSQVQDAPHCILWPDFERQWEPVIEEIQKVIPELYILGDFNSDKRSGPAIWLRCVVAGTVDVTFNKNSTPILYLPGISRQDLRATDLCPELLKPIAELQYRGSIWSQKNAKDWTVYAFLKSNSEGGLGLDISSDRLTNKAILRALEKIIYLNDEDIAAKKLDKEFFDSLLTSGDHIREILMLLDNGQDYISKISSNEWLVLQEILVTKYNYNPLIDNELIAIENLAEQEGSWKEVWDRFSESPQKYSNIPEKIKRAMPSNLFYNSTGWPQWNKEQEDKLRLELQEAVKLPTDVAINYISELNEKHENRKSSVWSELGEAPLANSLSALNNLLKATKQSLAVGELEDMVNRYIEFGWQADSAVLESLSFVKKVEDINIISDVIRSIYLPWLNESAIHLQKIIFRKGYPINQSVMPYKDFGEIECILFIDGLRLDLAIKLQNKLIAKDFRVNLKPKWSALPSITSTGKAAITPVSHLITGDSSSRDFEPIVRATGQSLKGGYHLKKLLRDEGWYIQENDEDLSNYEKVWCEFGDLDKEGHSKGWKIAYHVNEILDEIVEKIQQLMRNGCKKIKVVTDHGWLVMPGALPKIDLTKAISDEKWDRFALIKDKVIINENLLSWHWNSDRHFVVASGVSCFKKGQEYTHGGVSLQECLISEIDIYKN